MKNHSVISSSSSSSSSSSNRNELRIQLGFPSQSDTNKQSKKSLLKNRIETSKYNALTFLPKNLVVQFRKVANLYFVVIGICQSIRAISTTDGKPIIFMPLSIMVLISMVKDWVEDQKRRRRDEEENKSKAWRLLHTTNQPNSSFEEVNWENLKEGDVIRVREGEKFPADILILSTSIQGGSCFIETKNLDGETNLKHRGCIHPGLFRNEEDVLGVLSSGNYEITYETPNEFLHKFSGVLTEQSSSTRTLLSIENTAFRGCTLKRTQSVIGVVIFAGHSCKSLMNASSAHYKFSTIELGMNRMVITVFILLIGTSLFCSLYYTVWYDIHATQLPYLAVNSKSPENHLGTNFLAHLPMWILLLNTFVPISLLMTLEMVRYFQGQLLTKDKNFVNSISEELVEVNGSNLIDQLGSVSFVLTDKTGTLTGNSMKFKALSVNSTLFEHPNFDDKHPLQSEELRRRLRDPKKYPIETEAMICINICHQLIVEVIHGKIVYSGTSADEQCFLEFCTATGFYYTGISPDGIMSINDEINKRQLHFRVLEIHEYESSLAKMSILVQDLQTNQFKLYQKGSAYEIYKCLSSNTRQIVDVATTKTHIDYFATSILRTLCLCYRILSKEEVREFQSRLNAEMMACSVANLKMTKDLIFRMIESDQILLGGTGVNDEFQDQVPQTLANLRRSGIKVWMITGDKKETALSIASRCGMVYEGVHLKVFDENPNELSAEKQKTEQKIQQELEICLNYARAGEKFVVGVSGLVMLSLQQIEESSNLFQIFMDVFAQAESVVAYHFTPRQKQYLVKLVNSIRPNATVLAIGDGANDVSMIQAAHVGIGIRGKEGREAAKSADFSIGEFKHLNRLILYVGQEANRKNSQLILYNFYKNQAWNLTYVWYNFLCGQSGQFIYDQWVAQFFNVFFVSIPIIIYALFDEQYPSEKSFQTTHTSPNRLETEPAKYAKFVANPIFRQRNFFLSFAHGSIHAVLIVLTSYFIFGDSSNVDGRKLDIFQQGMYGFTCCVIICNLKVFQLHQTPSILSIISMLAGLVFYILILLLANRLVFLDSFNMISPVFSNKSSYLALLLVIMTTYGFDCAIDIFNKSKVSPSLGSRRLDASQNGLLQQVSLQPLIIEGEKNKIEAFLENDQDTDGSRSELAESLIDLNQRGSPPIAYLPPQRTYSQRSESKTINSNIDPPFILTSSIGSQFQPEVPQNLPN